MGPRDGIPYWGAWAFTSSNTKGTNHHWGVCSNTIKNVDSDNEELETCKRCANDKFNMMIFLKAEKGTVITVYDSR